MERLTDDRTAEALRQNIEKLRAAGFAIDPSDERYVRLADYERSGLDPEEISQTADVEPVRHGRWIVTGAAQYFLAKCSVCGRIEDRRRINEYPYCHCGAKMDGGDNNA